MNADYLNPSVPYYIDPDSPYIGPDHWWYAISDAAMALEGRNDDGCREQASWSELRPFTDVDLAEWSGTS